MRITILLLNFFLIFYYKAGQENTLNLKFNNEIKHYDCSLSNLIISEIIDTNKLEEIKYAKPPSPEISNKCPFISFTCCIEETLNDLIVMFKKNFKKFEDFLLRIKKNLEIVEGLENDILFIFKLVNNDYFELASECAYKNNKDFSNDEFKYRFGNIKIKLTDILNDINDIIDSFKMYYSGIICTLCDSNYIIDLKKIDDLNKEGKHERIQFMINEEVCLKLSRVHLKFIKISTYLIDIYTFIFDFFCIFHLDYKIDFAIGDFEDYTQFIERRKHVIDKCLLGQSFTNLSCELICRNFVKMFYWEDDYDMMRISEFNAIFLEFFIEKDYTNIKNLKSFLSINDKQYFAYKYEDWKNKYLKNNNEKDSQNENEEKTEINEKNEESSKHEYISFYFKTDIFERKKSKKKFTYDIFIDFDNNGFDFYQNSIEYLDNFTKTFFFLHFLFLVFFFNIF